MFIHLHSFSRHYDEAFYGVKVENEYSTNIYKKCRFNIFFVE